MIEDSSLKLIRTRRTLLKLERQFARMADYARKLDTRNKIELGGLVIKGGLSNEAKAVILGAIVAAKNEMALHPEYRDYLKSLGDAAFMEFDQQA